jgi:hypothetical protein
VSGLADATRPAAAPAPVLVDDDKTNIVPARADDIPPPPQKPKAIPSPAASVPPHLRSLGLTGSAAARNPDLTHEDIDVIEARRSAGALSDEQAAAPVPRQASVLPAAPASLAPASVLAPPAHVAEVTVTADRPPPLDDDIDLDAPTVEVQSVVRRGAVTSQIDIAASLMAGQEHSVDDLPPPPLEASGATRRPPPPAFAPSPPAAAPLAAPLALLPPTNAEPPPLAFSMEGRPASSMSSPPSLPPPRQPVGQPPSAPPPLAAPASAAPPAPPADDYEAAASLVWTAENPNAPLPPVAPLRPRTQDDVDGAMPSLTPAGARPQTAAPLPLPAPLPPQWTTPEAPAVGPGPGLKAAMFLFGALSGVVLLFVFLWVTGLSARVF